MQELALHKFDLNTLKDRPRVLLFLNDSRSKEEIMTHDIQQIIECLNVPTYSMTYDNFDITKLQEIVSKQKKAKIISKQKNTNHENICIVLNNIAFDKSIMKTDIIRELFLNGRLYGITFILSIQYLLELDPTTRTNIDNLFIYNQRDTNRLHRYFFGILEKESHLKKILDAPNNCIILNNFTKSDEIDKNIFWL
jgi:hypothetical protein